MIERGLACVSPPCIDEGGCDVVWKIQACTAQDKRVVSVNRASRARGAMPCLGDHRPIVTSAMKVFIAKQEAIQNPPRLILSNLMKDKTVCAVRAWPTTSQINNVLKRIRRDGGAKNSIKAIRELVRARFYVPNTDPATPFIFGHKRDAEGYAYVGSGEDDDPFILGVTSTGLIDNCLKYASGQCFAMFHADATFKLNDIGYPVITCGFTDRTRSYQVGAIFVVSQRTRNEYARCFGSFTRLVQDLRGQKLQVHAAMGDADDAQYLALSDIPELASAPVLMCFFHVLYTEQAHADLLTPGTQARHDIHHGYALLL